MVANRTTHQYQITRLDAMRPQVNFRPHLPDARGVHEGAARLEARPWYPL